MSQSTNTTLKYIKENSSSSLMEKLKLYENENKLLRNQLKENSKITELEMSNLKEKLIKEIQQISDKELEFKIQKQTFDENYSKVVKEKTQLEKKLAAKQEDYNRIKVENDGFLIKIREMSNEIPILKRQIASLEKNRNNHENESGNKIAEKEFEEIKDKNKVLEDKIAEISSSRNHSETNIQKILEEYNKMLENYSALSKKLEEKEHYNISQNDELNEIKMKLSQENEKLKKDLKKSQNNSKSLTLEKQNFLEEIKSVKNDLKVYESSCKNLKQCQLKLDSALKFLQDLLKVLKKDASKTLYTLIFKMIQKFQSNILSTNRNNPRKPLNIDDLNNSKISLKSEKNPSTKGKRSLSLSNKAQKTTKGTNIVNTSMFCLHKRTSSPMIKSQKILTRTENSSNKKKKTSKSRNPSPWKLSPKLSDRNSQCRDPGWANEKLCDIQNILKSGQESARNSFSKSKEKLNINHENSLIIASYCEKKKNDIKERIEKLDSQELTEEIFNLEKSLTQLKKDYKKLLGKSRIDKEELIRSEMNEMAKELEQKTEVLIWAKKELKKKCF